MPRNSAGTYSLPAAGSRPVVAGTVINPTQQNAVESDIAGELTNSLDRGGRGGMTAPLLHTDGTVTAPSISFNNETGTGWWRNAAGDLRLSVLGVLRMLFNAATGVKTVSAVADGSSAVGHTTDTTNALANATAKLHSFCTAGTEKAYILSSGAVVSFKSWHVLEKSADQSTSSNTLQNVTDLSFAVSANGRYEWECRLVVNRAGTATTENVGFSGPTAPTVVNYTSTSVNTASNASGLYPASTFGSAVAILSGNLAIGPFNSVVRGLLRNGANAGTVQLQFDSSDGATSVSILQGSTLSWRRLDVLE